MIVRGPVQDVRVDAVGVNVARWANRSASYRLDAETWGVFVGRHVWDPSNSNGAFQMFRPSANTAILLRQRAELDTPVLEVTAGMALSVPRGLWAGFAPLGNDRVGVGQAASGGQEWQGPFVAALTETEPTSYQASRLAQALARTL